MAPLHCNLRWFLLSGLSLSALVFVCLMQSLQYMLWMTKCLEYSKTHFLSNLCIFIIYTKLHFTLNFATFLKMLNRTTFEVKYFMLLRICLLNNMTLSCATKYVLLKMKNNFTIGQQWMKYKLDETSTLIVNFFEPQGLFLDLQLLKKN
jgi:hypothetical protein